MDQRTLYALIEETCKSQGHALGWRFLYSSWSTLSTAQVGLWGINPGGKADDTDRCNLLSVEQGTAYTHESWDGCAPGEDIRQKQVTGLFELLEYPLEKALLSNVIPFRSQDVTKLAKQKEAREFSRKIWKSFLVMAHCPWLTITYGNIATEILVEILDAIPDDKVLTQAERETAKRKTSLKIFKHNRGFIIGLPHFSRRNLLSKTESKQALQNVLQKYQAVNQRS